MAFIIVIAESREAYDKIINWHYQYQDVKLGRYPTKHDYRYVNPYLIKSMTGASPFPVYSIDSEWFIFFSNTLGKTSVEDSLSGVEREDYKMFDEMNGVITEMFHKKNYPHINLEQNTVRTSERYIQYLKCFYSVEHINYANSADRRLGFSAKPFEAEDKSGRVETFYKPAEEGTYRRSIVKIDLQNLE